MFQATLNRKKHPEAAGIKIESPIPEDQYESVILALEKMGIGSAGSRDCCILDIHAPSCPALYRAVGRMASVDELDWLGRKLERFDPYRLLQFNASAERFEVSSVPNLIDLSFCSDDVTVISDFGDLEQVGKRHYMTVRGDCNANKLKHLDGEAIALRLMSREQGHLTRYGVLYDNGFQLIHYYDRKHLQTLWLDETHVLEVEITPLNEEEHNCHEYVQLPTSEIRLERAMQRVGTSSGGKMQLRLSECRLPDGIVCTLDVKHESIFELNRLCQTCSKLKEQDLVKLNTICRLEKPKGAAKARRIAENLDQFDFEPNTHAPEKPGKHTPQQDESYEDDDASRKECMNTQICYLYRDASNYKMHNECVVAGELTQEQIAQIMGCCDSGEFFIPAQVGLPERRFDDIAPEDDHCWFELSADGFTPTAKPATVEVSARRLVENFAAAKEHWMDPAFHAQGQEMTL